MCARYFPALGDGGLWPFSAAALGLRYGLLVLLALSLLGLLEAAYRVRAAHKKALEGDFEKDPKN